MKFREFGVECEAQTHKATWRPARSRRHHHLCLLVPAAILSLGPLDLLLLQPLLLLLQVRRHVIEAHLLQVVEAAARAGRGCETGNGLKACLCVTL